MPPATPPSRSDRDRPPQDCRLPRRRLLALAGAVAGGGLVRSVRLAAFGAQPHRAAQTPMSTAIADLAAANRVLAQQHILDAFGHVSLRHPDNPDRFLLSRSLAPALVEPSDILEYDLDANPVDSRGQASYLERFIHSEIYRARPDVRAVVHCHTPSL